ncbi:hypothetical protein [Gilliamella sp.]|uniref:hypothetical protein n=1 Tax=Gilliamella sp. TaxID=1891236 RepID=UPI0025EA4945|nr:hypothetical protein [Gilliamella sp.]
MILFNFLFSLKSTSYTEISIFYTKYRLHGSEHDEDDSFPSFNFLNCLHGSERI